MSRAAKYSKLWNINRKEVRDNKNKSKIRTIWLLKQVIKERGDSKNNSIRLAIRMERKYSHSLNVKNPYAKLYKRRKEYRNEFYIWNTIKIGNNGVFTNFNYEYLANGLSMDDIVKVRNARK